MKDFVVKIENIHHLVYGLKMYTLTAAKSAKLYKKHWCCRVRNYTVSSPIRTILSALCS